MAERKAWWEILRDQFASRGLLDPESERVQETVRAAPAAQRQARGLLSLDPQAESDTALEMGLGALPGVGQAMALRDLERARRAKDPGAAAMAASAFIPLGRIAQEVRGAPRATQTAEETMQRMRELYGDFAQAYNLGLPDTSEYRRIVQEVTAQGPLPDDALLEAVRTHPKFLQAGGKARASEMRQANRGGAAALVDSLTGQGIKTRVETSKSPGSRSTYIYASKGGNTVKIRLSDHLPAESGRVYGTNDIMTTPQHWKSAAKRALKLLQEAK